MAQIIPRVPTLSELTGSIVSWKELGIPNVYSIDITENLIKYRNKFDFWSVSILLPPACVECHVNDLSNYEFYRLNILSGNLINDTILYYNPQKIIPLNTNVNVVTTSLCNNIETTRSLKLTNFNGDQTLDLNLKCNELTIDNASGVINSYNITANKLEINVLDSITLKGNFNVRSLNLNAVNRDGCTVTFDFDFKISDEAVISEASADTYKVKIINYADLSNAKMILGTGTIENYGKIYAKRVYNTTITNYSSGIIEIEKFISVQSLENYGKIVIFNKSYYKFYA